MLASECVIFCASLLSSAWMVEQRHSKPPALFQVLTHTFTHSLPVAELAVVVRLPTLSSLCTASNSGLPLKMIFFLTLTFFVHSLPWYAHCTAFQEPVGKLSQSGPEVIKLFSCSTQLSMKF